MPGVSSVGSGIAFIDEFDGKTEISSDNEFIRRPQAVESASMTDSGSVDGGTDRPATHSERQKHHSPQTPLVRLPPRSLPTASVQVLQRWEGIVTDVDSDSFWAELKDLAETDYPLELIEMPVAEVHSDDRRLITPGACFYWSIGIRTNDRQVITRVSEIRFQRLPAWTIRSIAAAKREAETKFGSFWAAEHCSAQQ